MAAVAQSRSEIDSIYLHLRHSPDDTNKIYALKKVIRYYSDQGDSMAMDAAKYGLEVSERLHFATGRIRSWYELGWMLKKQGQNVLARTYLDSCYREAERTNNKEYLAACLSNFSSMSRDEGNFEEALTLCLRSLHLSEEIGNKNFCLNRYLELNSIFKKMKQPARAMEFSQKALDLAIAIRDTVAIGDSYGAMAATYSDLSQFEEAREHLGKKMAIAVNIREPSYKGGVYYDLGRLYIKMKRYWDAIPVLQTAVSWFEKAGYQNYVAMALVKLTEAELESGDITGALKDNRRVWEMSQGAGLRDNLLTCYLVYAKAFRAQNRNDLAYRNLERYYNLRDSILDVQKAKNLNELMLRYQHTERELKLARFTASQLVFNNEMKQQLWVRNTLLAMAVLLLTIGGLLVNRMQMKRKSEIREKDLLRLQEMESIRKNISADLHDDIGSTLSSIHILSTMKESDPQRKDLLLEKIHRSSQHVLEAMDDIVWMVNPRNDSLENLIVRMQEFAADVLEVRNIDYTFSVDGEIDTLKVPMSFRKDFYLIFKEAINNVAKHAGCSFASILIMTENNALKLVVQDNGKGISYLNGANRNGLKNMEQRAKKIGGVLSVQSSPETGTCVELYMTAA